MTARGVVVLLALLVASVGVLGPQAVGASEHRSFTAEVMPSTIAAGVSQTFTATLTNTSTQHQLGSADLTAPPSLTLTGVSQPTVDGAPTGSASLVGDTVELRGLSAAPGSTIRVAVAGTAACVPSSGAWTVTAKRANDFSGGPGNDLSLRTSESELSLQVTGTCRLAFVDHPNHAEPHPTVISSAVGDPAGPPITVAAVDGDDQPITSFTGDVTVAIGHDPSPGATLRGTETQTAVAGVASFHDLTIDQLGVGYTLVASSPDLQPATSHGFGIWQDIGLCAQGTCTASAEDPGSMSASVTANSSMAGAILLSFGVDSVDCGDTANHAPTTTTVDSVDVDGIKTATITVAKAVDQEQPNNGVSFYEVCYASPEPFTDQDGNQTTQGLLPDCGPTVGPPCVASRTKTKAGDVQITISLPAADPAFR